MNKKTKIVTVDFEISKLYRRILEVDVNLTNQDIKDYFLKEYLYDPNLINYCGTILITEIERNIIDIYEGVKDE